jgi:hydroxymethylbilane synthase
MTTLRVGTRGSDLALWQTTWVCDHLRDAHPFLALEPVVITTHGDLAADERIGPSWPAGAFVAAVEAALLDGRVDMAVHSYKDLPTVETAGLCVAATPERGPVHDVLLTRSTDQLAALPDGARIGTNSARRAAQIARIGRVEIVPIRGNVPTRIARIEREGLDGVILAAAGLTRLGIDHPHRIDLPPDRFVPAPAQGALAVQTRAGTPTERLAAAVEHRPTRLAVTAERAVLRTIDAGCHTPVGALATVSGDTITLHAQLFSSDLQRMAEGIETRQGVATPDDAAAIGTALARRLMDQLDRGERPR